jgi:4-hydroxy-tetrahydrodipicolinate synthase
VHGIHTALVTPFAADGALDLPAYDALVERQLAHGVHGLVACGTTGETPTLEPAEWDLLVSRTVALSRGRVPVTAGVGTNHTAGTVRNVARARELGADYGLLVLPYYNKPNPAGLREHVRQACAVGLPLVVYHVPGRTGQRVGEKLLAELASMPGVAAVKEATGDLKYGTDVLAATTTPVLSGDDFSFLGLLAQGGAGCISVVSNVAPAQTVAIYDHHRAGRHQEAAGGLLRLWELITFLFADTNPVPCKAALAALGLCRPDVRLPLAPHQGLLPLELVQRALR